MPRPVLPSRHRTLTFHPSGAFCPDVSRQSPRRSVPPSLRFPGARPRRVLLLRPVVSKYSVDVILTPVRPRPTALVDGASLDDHRTRRAGQPRQPRTRGRNHAVHGATGRPPLLFSCSRRALLSARIYCSALSCSRLWALAGYRENQHQPRIDDGCHRSIVAVKNGWSTLENKKQKRERIRSIGFLNGSGTTRTTSLLTLIDHSFSCYTAHDVAGQRLVFPWHDVICQRTDRAGRSFWS
jgi:hypothetical protein